MPGKKRYGTVGNDSVNLVVQKGLGINAGNATMVRLEKLFKPIEYKNPDDPSNDGVYNDANMPKIAEKLLFSDLVDGDPLIWPGGVDRTLSASPDIPKDVKVGGDGLPTTAYSPNPGAPGADPNGAVNIPEGGPTGQPDLTGQDLGHVTKTLANIGTGGTKNPKTEAASINASQKAGTMTAGSHNADPSIGYVK